jgi:hypothetical protein
MPGRLDGLPLVRTASCENDSIRRLGVFGSLVNTLMPISVGSDSRSRKYRGWPLGLCAKGAS